MKPLQEAILKIREAERQLKGLQKLIAGVIVEKSKLALPTEMSVQADHPKLPSVSSVKAFLDNNHVSISRADIECVYDAIKTFNPWNSLCINQSERTNAKQR